MRKQNCVGWGLGGLALAAALSLGSAPPAQAGMRTDCLQQGWLRCSGLQLDTGWPGPGGATSTGVRYNFGNRLGEDSGPLHFHVDARLESQQLLRRWRYGAGVNLDLPADGMLEASLYTSRRRGREGPRYALGDDGLTRSGAKHWAFGAYMAPVKGSNSLTVAPRLRFDLDEYELLPGRAELSMEYAPWERSDADHRGDRVWQLNLYWRY